MARIASSSNGSITSIQAVYVPADDMTDPAPATMFIHLDATTVLARSLAAKGIYPAVDVLDSTSTMLQPWIVGEEHLHSGTVVGKLEGDRAITLGFVDLMREECVQQDRSRGVFFTQDWASLPAVMPVASGGIHIWHMPALVDIFGDDACLQFGGGTLGHPRGNAPGAVANRVALEACVLARNSGVKLAQRGAEIIREACQFSPELAAAADVGPG